MASAQATHPKRIWTPVRQQAADSFLILLIASFAVTVMVTRFFCNWRGIPKWAAARFTSRTCYGADCSCLSRWSRCFCGRIIG